MPCGKELYDKTYKKASFSIGDAAGTGARGPIIFLNLGKSTGRKRKAASGFWKFFCRVYRKMTKLHFIRDIPLQPQGQMADPLSALKYGLSTKKHLDFFCGSDSGQKREPLSVTKDQMGSPPSEKGALKFQNTRNQVPAGKKNGEKHEKAQGCGSFGK